MSGMGRLLRMLTTFPVFPVMAAISHLPSPSKSTILQAFAFVANAILFNEEKDAVVQADPEFVTLFNKILGELAPE